MALQYTVRPISDRSPFTGNHVGSPFTVKWHQVLDLLQREYEMLAGRSLVIEVDVPESGIRNDGLLRADARAASPAVRIAFESKHGPITMATDRFVRQPYRSTSMPDWQHNVYAIAKALEALRMVDRYGVTKRGEQYTGWKALPAGSGIAPTGMTTNTAVRVITQEAGLTPDPAGVALRVGLPNLLRSAKAHAHPDRNGGDRSRWDAVEQAEQVLRRAGRLS